jgi:hypothetical protein
VKPDDERDPADARRRRRTQRTHQLETSDQERDLGAEDPPEPSAGAALDRHPVS